jgi:diadenosine tetraphosphate (Ap4A) HIT family hydrolase
MNKPVCPFCAAEGSVLGNEQALARWDANPVTPGHLLVMTRRYVADFFERRDDERWAMPDLVPQGRNLLQREDRPDGFNIGVNVGESAGQTRAHAPIHLVPRSRGDTPRPRGGLRGVIPDRQWY